MKKLEKSFYWLCFVLAIYAIVGFTLIPVVLKNELIKNLDENLTQKTNIAKIEFNPFTFKVVIYNFRLADEKDTTTIYFKEFAVKFAFLKSIKNLNISFKDIVLKDAFVNILEEKDGSINLTKLIKPLPMDEKKEEKPTTSSNIDFLVSKFVLDNANIRYAKEDDIPYSLDLNNINYTLYDLGTYKNILSSNDLNFKLNEHTNISIGGAFNLVPFKAYGKISIEDLRIKELLAYKKDFFNFDINEEANLNLILNYNLDTTEDLALQLRSDKFEFNKINLNQNKTSIASLDKLDIKTFTFDLQKQDINFDNIDFNTLKVNMISDKNGINFAKLIKEKNTTKVEKQDEMPTIKSTKTEEISKPWNINLSNFRLNNSDFSFADKINNNTAQSKAFNINLDNLKIVNSDINLDNLLLKAPTLSYDDNKNNLFISSNNTNISLNKLKIANNKTSFDDISLKSSTLNFDDTKSKMQINASNLNLNVNTFLLDNEVISVKTVKLIKPSVKMSDKINNIELNVKDIQLQVDNLINNKDDLSISSIKLLESNLDFLNTSDKTKIEAKNLDLVIKKLSNSKKGFKIENTNLNKPNISVILAKKDFVKIEEKSVEKPKITTEVETNKNKQETKSPKTKIDIGPMNITNAIFTFEDKNLPLPFKTTVTKLNGKISEFKNTRSGTTDLEVKGVVDEYGVAKITGIVHPDNIKILTDINLIFNNIAIKNFTPYSGKFVGREIKDGKLDLDLKYNIEKSNLEAKNNIVITKLELGDKVESPDAISLPLDIAITLLKDSQGIIDINLPVSGNVDDPQFAIGSIVWNAFINLMTKAVTAPFSLLGALFNFSEDEIKTVKFAPLEQEVGPIQKETLDKIAQILKSKSEIAIELTASYKENDETYALKKANYLARKDDDRNLKREEIEALIQKENIKIADLEKIAKSRVTNINNYLIKEKGINSKQIVITNKIENSSSSINLNISKSK
ncbi:DUF748 domain-containing protein [Arcobacter caeni]|uniref:DUF748 domain-containing membrane protein n=1 Tax=Arcobacter caeni TaxID=1912877 RepID=A0A363D1D7_9BACT|nr:DUF748 domain-containing protein [Arcobacter caeni]PUE65124.1 hypothetical protein B0174_04815 [Arcobacter caeni]